MKRTRLGFDTAHYSLDAVIEPDLEHWSWKDEDEFGEAVRLSFLTESHAAVIRKETRVTVHRLLTAGREDMLAWATWRPPADWPLPSLPPDWQVL